MNTMCWNIIVLFLVFSEMLERPLEKKAGRNYAPSGNKRLIYFVDDMNMTATDCYGTVQPHTLIRQHLDYKHWLEKCLHLYMTAFINVKPRFIFMLCCYLSRYDRQKLALKEIHNTQYVACLNPQAGSYTINPRLQVQYQNLFFFTIFKMH